MELRTLYWITAKMRSSVRLMLLFACMGFFMCGDAAGEQKKITIGCVEEIVLVPWEVRLPARVDTGAATCSLDARDIAVKGDTVEFRLPEKYGGKQLSLPLAGWKTVWSSRARDRRPVVVLEFCLGGKLIRTKANLNDRSRVKYPFLVGRNALKKDFVVDCTRERRAQPACPEGKTN